MIKDLYLKAFFISLPGVLVPFVSGIFSYPQYNTNEIIAAELFFILISFLVGAGNEWMQRKFRSIFPYPYNPYLRISAVCLLTLVYGIISGGITGLVWVNISLESFDRVTLLNFTGLCVFSLILFNLVKEIVSSDETSNVVSISSADIIGQKIMAQTRLTRNELDPHFMLNSLTTLSHLISNEAPKAHIFNSKLASVYKYFLITRDKELVLLSQELEFIENYFYLLQVRHDSKLQLNIEPGTADQDLMILPFALQVVVENAVRHNEYTDTDPLKINVSVNSHYLIIMNNIKHKPYLVSAGLNGLSNLDNRYRLVCNKEIVIENSDGQFEVRLPLIRNQDRKIS